MMNTLAFYSRILSKNPLAGEAGQKMICALLQTLALNSIVSSNWPKLYFIDNQIK